MATITPVLDTPAEGAARQTWTGITTTTDAPAAVGPIRGQGYRRATVQFSGTFAGGSSASLMGSNDGTTFCVLDDINGDAITVTAASIKEFGTSALYIKPQVLSGAGDNVDCIVIARN